MDNKQAVLEVPLGTAVAAASMIMALLAYVPIPRFRLRGKTNL